MKSLTLRIDDDLHDAIRHVAYTDRMSINAVIAGQLEWMRGIGQHPIADTSVEDKANARASLTHATESRDA